MPAFINEGTPSRAQYLGSCKRCRLSNPCIEDLASRWVHQQQIAKKAE